MNQERLEQEIETVEDNQVEETLSNPELDAVVEATEGESASNEPEAPTVLMTATDARAVVALGAVKLTHVVGDLTKTQLEPDERQIDNLANQVHPVLLKYAAALESPPPWLASLLQYRAEAVALYAITVFGLGLRSAVVADKARQRKAAQRQQQGAGHGDQPE